MKISNLRFIARRAPRRVVTLVALAALIAGTAGFKGCPQSEKDRNIAFARDIVSAFELAGPIITRKKPELAAVWNKGTESARKLVDAVAASNETEIGALLRDILPTVTEVAKAFIGDNEFEWVFALGQIALNFFVNHYLKTATAENQKAGPARSTAIAADVEIIERFRALPQFGCRLKPERCR